MTYTKVRFLSVTATGGKVLKQAAEWVVGRYGVRRPSFRTESSIYCRRHRRASCKLYIRCVQISPSKKTTVFVFAYYVWLHSSVGRCRTITIGSCPVWQPASDDSFKRYGGLQDV